MISEPRLSEEDRRCWNIWQRTAAVHAQSKCFMRRVDQAKRILRECNARTGNPCLMWSGGKDSTVLAHLVCVEAEAPMRVYSEKDDLDYPGERRFVERLGRDWKLDLHILEPPMSPAQWIAEHADELDVEGDMHSRAAELSKTCFYEVVEQASANYDAILLGLRKDESRGRLMNRSTRGPLYAARGRMVCTPLCDWSGLDIMAYTVSRGLPVLDVYKCVALMHADEPWRVRKSWWLPGSHARWGGVVWLRHYWPSLYWQLVEWLPGTCRLA